MTTRKGSIVACFCLYFSCGGGGQVKIDFSESQVNKILYNWWSNNIVQNSAPSHRQHNIALHLIGNITSYQHLPRPKPAVCHKGRMARYAGRILVTWDILRNIISYSYYGPTRVNQNPRYLWKEPWCWPSVHGLEELELTCPKMLEVIMMSASFPCSYLGGPDFDCPILRPCVDKALTSPFHTRDTLSFMSTKSLWGVNRAIWSDNQQYYIHTYNIVCHNILICSVYIVVDTV